VKKALPLVLLVGAALLFGVGLAAIGARFYFERGQSVDLSQWKAPLDQVDAKRITPANALETLAGVGDVQAIDDALQQGDWESAFGDLAYTPDLADVNRAGTLLLLGSRYAAAKQTAKAAWAYQYAATLATISPLPSELVRVQTLLQAAQGLRSLGLLSAARAALDQAYLITEYSYSIPRDTHARLFEQIASEYQAFGVTSLATQAKQKSEEAAALASEEAVAASRPPFHIQPLALPGNQELQDKTKARVTAAKELIDQLNLRPPKSDQDLPQDLIRNLGDRLYEEDGLRKDYYEAQYKTAADAPAQAALLRDRIRWLALKLRLARGGFGLSLVPEWETDARNIAGELSDTFDQLFKLSEQQAGTAEKAADADQQVEDVLRGELVAGRWGLYGYDENDLRSRLDEISSRLRDEQVAALRLEAYQKGTVTLYLLVPDELYGQGEKALPR
jgi:hypothetical protein